MFAADRIASYHSEWKKFYEEKNNGIILLDRYITSNAIQFGAKINNPADRYEFFYWLEKFENNTLSLPKPDAVLVLDVPPETSMKLTAARGTQDIHERDERYVKSCYESMMQAADYYGWNLIKCVNNNELESIYNIHCSIMDSISTLLPQAVFGPN